MEEASFSACGRAPEHVEDFGGHYGLDSFNRVIILDFEKSENTKQTGKIAPEEDPGGCPTGLAWSFHHVWTSLLTSFAKTTSRSRWSGQIEPMHTTKEGSVMRVLITLLIILVGCLPAGNPSLHAAAPATPQDETDSQAFTLQPNKSPDTDIRVRLKSDKAVTNPGDEITLTLESDTDGYVSLLYLSESGKVLRLWPRQGPDEQSRIYANRPITIPGPGAPFKIVTDGSSGAEDIIALVTRNRGVLLRDSDFDKQGADQPVRFIGDTARLVDEFAQRSKLLSPSEKWGIAEIVVPVAPADPALREMPFEAPPDGSARVTLHVYSGIPDPTWTVPREKAMELARIISTAATKGLKSMPVNDGLGYGGISVQGLPGTVSKGLVHFFDNAVNIDGLEAKGLDMPAGEVEKWLLQTAGDAVDGELKQFVQEEVLRPKNAPRIQDPGTDEQGPGPDLELKAFHLSAPQYNPGKWNSNRYICARNNCYNYGNDRMTNTFAQPGRSCGHLSRRPFTCVTVTRAALCDGLEQLNPNMVPREAELAEKAREFGGSGGHVLALVVWGRDFHWYRRDSNGTWSHKPGSTRARDIDNSGRKIYDVRRADHGPYRFCGFFLSRTPKARIK